MPCLNISFNRYISIFWFMKTIEEINILYSDYGFFKGEILFGSVNFEL